MNAGSLQALSYSGGPSATAGSVVAYQNRPLSILATAYSNTVHLDGGQLLLFDGDPSTGAAAVAAEDVHPGENGPTRGSSAWLTWTPTTIGVHHLYATVLDEYAQAASTGQVAELDVNVLGFGDVNGDGTVNQADVTMLQANVGKSVDTSSCGKACDLDGDGRITALDLNILQQFINSNGTPNGQ